MLALYRKYRPKTLSEVIGQDQVIKPLETALKSGKVSHSYLFTGPRGCGKTSVARILAHEINGFKYELEDSYLDIIEIDAASNTGVDNIRDLREKAIIAPSEGKYKVYIIDEIHMLSKSAFNALLKTLEEPPAHTVFILATTDLEKVPVTITSRSQVFTFRLAEPETLLKHLETICEKEKITISSSALALIVKKSGGSFRDSLSILDQIASLSENGAEISEKMVADCLGLPLDSAIKTLFDAYLAHNHELITKTLKELISSGIKPESIASSAIATIIQTPRPELLPLLDKLPKVTAPYPEAKLLLSFFEPASYPANQPSTKTQPIILASTKTTITDLEIKEVQEEPLKEQLIPAPEAEPNPTKNTAENPKPTVEPPKTAIAHSIESEVPQASFTTLSQTIVKRLQKCRITQTENEINIYPSIKIVKAFLERPSNYETLKNNFNKAIIIHELDENENQSQSNAISDIMGKVQEVNNSDGGIPF